MMLALAPLDRLNGKLRRNLLSVAGVLGFSVLSPVTFAQECACIQTNMEGAGEISGLVASGSASVTQVITKGFEATGSTIEQAIGEQTSDLEGFLSAITKTLVTEIDKIPIKAQKLETELERLSPARHVTNGCGYNKRTQDSRIADRLTSLQEDNLNAASAGYNKMTSSYPAGIDPTDRYYAQTGRMLRENPDIETAGMDWLNKTNGFGALEPEDMQNASTFINVTTNPNPPQVRRDAGSIGGLKKNVEAELFNMRMSISQAVQNQLLSYRAPVVQDGGGADGEDSWLIDQLSNLSPATAQAVKDGDISVSKEDLIKLMATHRVQDSSWVANLSAKHSDGVVKDLALLKADSLKMDYELWLQDRNTSLLMSQMLAAQIRKAKGE